MFRDKWLGLLLLVIFTVGMVVVFNDMDTRTKMSAIMLMTTPPPKRPLRIAYFAMKETLSQVVFF